jgi:hypothetical protein
MGKQFPPFRAFATNKIASFPKYKTKNKKINLWANSVESLNPPL